MPYNQTAVGMGGAGGMGRDRITSALMAIQNPPPVSSMPQQPPPVMAPPGGGGGLAAAPNVGGAGTMPGAVPPMMPQMNAAVPGAMQPGGMMAPGMGMQQSPMMGQQQMPQAQPPAMGAQY